MRAEEILGYFKKIDGTWVCTKPVTLELPDGHMNFKRGDVIASASQLSDIFDQLADRSK